MKKTSYFTDKKRYIAMIHFEHCKSIIQDYLRVVIEKNILNTFLIFTTHYQALREAIRSRCVAIRVPSQAPPYDFTTPSDKLTDHLIDIYTHDFEALTLHKLQKLKDISSDIYKYNLSMTDILRELLAKLMKHVKWTHAIKYDIVSYIADQQYIYIHSYRSLINTESSFFNLYYRLAEAPYS